MAQHDALGSKRCSRCGRTLSLDRFGRRCAGRYWQSYCRDCEAAYQRERWHRDESYRAQNRERVRRYRAAQKEAA